MGKVAFYLVAGHHETIIAITSQADYSKPSELPLKRARTALDRLTLPSPNPLTVAVRTELLGAPSAEPDGLQRGATLPAPVTGPPRPRSHLHVGTIIPRGYIGEGGKVPGWSFRWPTKNRGGPDSL